MFVYLRHYYRVFEPAEGGYYVTCSEVCDFAEFDNMADAIADMDATIMDVLEDCYVNNVRYRLDVVEPWIKMNLDDEPYALGISMEKPEDRPYLGYC